jgi:hypothetical protein
VYASAILWINSNTRLRTTPKLLIIANLMHWRAGSSRSENSEFYISFLRKGEVLAYVGRITT